MENLTDTEKDVVRKIFGIFDWPLPPEEIVRVYSNFYSIISDSVSSGSADWEFFESITKLDVNQRRDYRNKLASVGHELRPDELNQYICIIMLVMINIEKRIKEESERSE
jgi:hypothetical protein